MQVHQTALRRKAVDVAVKVVAADDIQHRIDARAACSFLRHLTEVFLAVTDRDG